MADTYKVIRYWQHPLKAAVVLKKGLTLEEAQKHCSDPETSSKTCTKPTNKRRTNRYGHWFDGYTKE